MTVAATPVTPTAAGDYTLSTNKTLTIAAGATTSTGEVTITAVDNDVDTLDKTVTVSATATNTQGITAPQDATLTITDDDAPTLSIGDASVTEGDSGESPTLTFTVTLTPAATLPVTVDWATSDGTATAGTDYTAANGSLRFETGEDSKTVAVTVTGDDADEPNETFTVTLSDQSGATITDATATGTITDDDGPPTVTLVLTPASISENGETSTVTATLDHPSSEDTTVTVSAAPVSPAVANDYTLVGSQLTIAAGETNSTGVVTITATNNAVYEGNKQVTVSGTATNDQGVSGPADETLTITEDDAAPGLSIADASVDEGDTGSATMTFTVTLAPAAVAPVTVDWATSDGTATAGTDYTAGNGTLTFDAQDSSKTFTVTVTGDEVDEPNETFTVTLSNAQGATIGKATATGTITDDDAPELSIGDASVDEGASGESPTMTFTVTLSPAATLPVTVDWATADGTATAGADYTAGSGSLTFGSGDDSKTFTVTVTGDEVDEPNETFTVTLSDAQGATIGDGTGTGTITDDDATPAVTLVLTPASISENGGTSTVTATLDRPSSEGHDRDGLGGAGVAGGGERLHAGREPADDCGR